MKVLIGLDGDGHLVARPVSENSEQVIKFIKEKRPDHYENVINERVWEHSHLTHIYLAQESQVELLHYINFFTERGILEMVDI